jgi:cytidine deaminase
MQEVALPLEVVDAPYIASVRNRIAYANAVRGKLGDDALAALAISAIRTFREETRSSSYQLGTPGDMMNPDEAPLPAYAYIIRQLKRPEEVALLRAVYGKQFVLISAYAPQDSRLKKIQQTERSSRGGLISDVDLHNLSFSLIDQDSRELQEEHGQNVRDAFPLGDVFIDVTSEVTCEKTLKRFVHLLFGHNHITPDHDEYAMYIANCVSLRSSDLSRQVGAAVFATTGEIIAMGCNEVPKTGGGTYWCGDSSDGRDFVQGYDPNELRKIEILVDFLNRLRLSRCLSDDLLELADPYDMCKKLLSDSSMDGLAESQVMDLLEFGRIIHAEMSALCDAARRGLSVGGATLYTTTFPCHMCAKHIVASGIMRVVYLEPYAKSYASDLHSDSIEVEPSGSISKVLFEPFIGVSPFRYRDLFEKGKRKYSGGLAKKWDREPSQPMIDVYYPAYFKSEAAVVESLKDGLLSLTDAPRGAK